MNLSTAVHDSWSDSVSAEPQEFGVSTAYVAGTRHIQRVPFRGRYAYRKWDRKSERCHYRDGARDKVAYDLADHFGVNVPPTLLWKYQDYFAPKQPIDFGCVQDEPVQNIFSLGLFFKVFGASDDKTQKELQLRRLVDSYEPINYLFDIWLANCDRAENYGNILAAETNSCLTLWLIDYNCSLGHLENRWEHGKFKKHGFSDRSAPVPKFVKDDPVWIKRLEADADNLIERMIRVESSVIQGICERSFEFYGDRAEGSRLADCLEERRSRLKEWALELLQK